MVYSIQHLRDHADALPSIKNSKIVLTEGFFTEHSAEVALKVLDVCLENGIVTAFNMSGRVVVEQYFEKAVEPFVKTCDVVVGNLDEFNSLRGKLGVRSDRSTKEAAIDVHKVMILSHRSCRGHRIQSLERYKKILIVTNGDEDVLCVTGCDELITYAVPRLASSQIKDTTGAGDAFLAGFLYALLKERPISKCLEMACHVAGQIVQQYGVTLPDGKVDFPDCH